MRMDDTRIPTGAKPEHEADHWGYSTQIAERRAPGVRIGKEAPDEPRSEQARPKQSPPKEKQANAEESGAPEKPPMPRWKKLLYWTIGILVVAALVIGGFIYRQYSSQFESTDDAFIDGHISQVSAQIAAKVIKLDIVDNQQVKAGQLLLELDPRDYQIKVDQAHAQLTQAKAQLAQSQAQTALQQANVDQARANVRVTEADLAQAQSDLGRYRAVDPKAITRQQVDTAQATARSAQARLDANRQAVAGADAQLLAQKASVDAAVANVHIAEVAVANAELQLSYARVLAPTDGRVTKRTVEVGNYANPGQSLLAVVSPEMWVTANFKETQLAHMRAGQKVTIAVDACPNLEINAKVDSFQTGSGNAFSALPAENATGNYVKVVQRVPVKIVFDDDRVSQCRLAPGISVTPQVTVK